MNYILSWPRSGNTLFRGFFEFLTETPTTSPSGEEGPVLDSFLKFKKKEKNNN